MIIEKIFVMTNIKFYLVLLQNYYFRTLLEFDTSATKISYGWPTLHILSLFIPK